MISPSKFPADIPDMSYPHMSARRIFFFTLAGLTILLLVNRFVAILSVDGFGWLDLIMTILFVICLPWTVIGFWNATIGFLVMRMSADPVVTVTPGAGRVTGEEAITTSTAIVICIRNEDVQSVFRNIRQMALKLAETGFAQQFHFYILSDTTDVLISQSEEEAAHELSRNLEGRLPMTYRLRDENPGFKAGNIRDFCDRWGADHDFMITLDADSYMSTPAILNLVRLMQADARLGLMQYLTVGLPSTSAFTRIFQFGMRLGMRSYTVGSAWWQGECGPYWGHNAILRLAPFIAHCNLPKLPGTGPLSGWVLSHDQLEAVMIRKAGYECRVLPLEDGSYEENPPSLTEFIRRDLRWCQGNMQYLKLLGLKGAKPISQYQLVFAILMFIGSPAALLFGLIAILRLLLGPLLFIDQAPVFDTGGARNLVLVYLFMGFAPKLATLGDVLLNRDLCAAYGGRLRVIFSALIETLFSFLIVPIMTVSEGIFLIELAFGKIMGWSAQQRGEYQLGLGEATRRLLPHTLIGFSSAIAFGMVSKAAFWWTLPLTAGLMLSIPFAVLTTMSGLGRLMMRLGICRLPEETNPPEDLKSLGNAAINRQLA